jgi:hypothetical protein
VEFGAACFCSHVQVPAGITPLPISQCANMTCAGAPQEKCGGANILSVFSTDCPEVPGLPPNLYPPMEYFGPTRLFPTAVRTVVGVAEQILDVEMAVLASQPPSSVKLTWWLVAGGGAAGNDDNVGATNTTVTMALETVGRGLYTTGIKLPTSDPTQTLEYVVEATWNNGVLGPLVWPVEGVQSVVLV